MKYHMDRTLRLSVETELGGIDSRGSQLDQIIREILRKYESTGLACRYVRKDGNIGWRATDKFRQELFEQEQELIEEWDDHFD
jgi:hypothetical protein